VANQAVTASVRLAELWQRIPLDARNAVLGTMTKMIQQTLPEREVKHD
jgi:delta 1-pyrroline-5-carboxylate dehydrogenase